MKIIFISGPEGEGCTLYRFELPAKYLAKQFPNTKIYILPCYSQWATPEWLNSYVHGINEETIVVIRAFSGIAFELIDYIKGKKAKLVVDLDDNVLNPPFWLPLNRAVKEDPLGYKVVKEIIQSADLVTVTTPKLKEAFNILNSNITVLDNYIDVDFWKNIKKGYQLQRPISSIGWAGSSAREPDFADTLKKFCYKDDVAVVIWGQRLDWEATSNLENYSWIDLKYFPYQLWRLNVDILTAPLSINEFNECRSAIKILEAGICESAVVATNIEPYKILPENCGILVENNKEAWDRAILRLIKDKDLVIQMGKNLCEFVHEHYDIKNNVHQWQKAYERLVK